MAATLLTSHAGFTQSASLGAQAVGTTGGEQSITVKAGAAGTVASIGILTQGISGLNFAAGIGANTCASATLAVNNTCSVSVTFTPAWPGLRSGAIVLLDSASRVLGTAYISGAGIGGLGVLRTGNILPVAGNGFIAPPILDGGNAIAAPLDSPSSVALDGAGNLYIADRGHNRIRKIDAASGIIATIAGNGLAAYSGDGLASTDPGVSLSSPSGVDVDGAGNVYIADTANNVIREIVAATGIISTIAGSGAPGGNGDDGAATSATLNQPRGVTIDASGNLYIADTANHRIRRVDPFTGIITTIAGNGYTDPSTGAGGDSGYGGAANQAELSFPYAVAFDPAGNMYIADSGNNAVRIVAISGGVLSASSIINTYAGIGAAGYAGDSDSAAAAELNAPSGVAVDAAANVYIADTGNDTIRKVSGSTGLISTIARNNVGEYVYNNGGPYAVSIYGPLGLMLDGAGDLYFADALNNRIREIQSNFGILDYTGAPVSQGSQSAAQSMIVENDGNAPLDLASIAPDSNSAVDASTTCAAAPPSLAVNDNCIVAAVFAPTAVGDPLLGHVNVAAATPDSPLDIELIGDAIAVGQTSTALTSSLNPSGFGQAVTLTATVSAGSSLSGTVTFYDGATQLGSPIAVSASGTATLELAALSVGVHSITASYSGDHGHAASVSAALNQAVLEGTSTTLASSANPSAIGQQVTFTATVAASGGGGVQPQGSVTFTDGSATLATVTLSAGGVVSYSTATLTAGTHSVIATYSGDAAHQVSNSISVMITQDVKQPSTVVATSAPSPSVYNTPVNITVMVEAAQAPTPTGSFLILDGSTQIGTGNLAGANGSGVFTTSTLAIGSHTITAVYLGDTSNAPSTSAPVTQIVNSAPTTTSLTATPNPAAAASSVTLIATVQAGPGQAAQSQAVQGQPAGSVTFTDTFNGAALSLGAATLGSGGSALLTHVFAAGSHSIVAAYAGSPTENASASAPLMLIVQPAQLSIAVVSSLDPSIADASVTFTATLTGAASTPTGTIAFLADGASIGTAAVNASGTPSLSTASFSTASFSTAALAPGSHQITAIYSGDSNNAAATSAAISQVVETIPTTTALTTGFTSTAAAVSSPAALNIIVSSSSGPTPTGTVTFLIGTAVIGTAAVGPAGSLTFTPTLAPGTAIIVASYGGDALHSPSVSQGISVLTPPNTFSLTVAPSSLTITTTQPGAATVTLAASGTFSDTITLACDDLPANLTCQFGSASVSLPTLGTASTQLTISDAQTTAAIREGASRTTPVLACLCLPLALLFGFIFARFRKHHGCFQAAAWLLLLCLHLLTTGCTSVHLNGPRTGTYAIQVTGTGVKTGIIQSQSLTVTVNP
jgi:sugar lactone lactonase YvrE